MSAGKRTTVILSASDRARLDRLAAALEVADTEAIRRAVRLADRVLTFGADAELLIRLPDGTLTRLVLV